jgi:hypothetical protein
MLRLVVWGIGRPLNVLALRAAATMNTVSFILKATT